MTSLHITFKNVGPKNETAQIDFLNTVINFLGLLVRKCDVLYNDGYGTISNIIHWKYNMVREWFTTKSKLSTTIVEAPY